ncbi:MAG: hypothetical protein GC159_06485 [Phycisphaera sp.]|nr:hypothetical protein [Phycisphaera sp.]
MWTLTLDDVKHVLDNLGGEFPELAGRKYEIAGFGWHWNHNGITHYKIGEAMGQAMLKLIGR